MDADNKKIVYIFATGNETKHEGKKHFLKKQEKKIEKTSTVKNFCIFATKIVIIKILKEKNYGDYAEKFEWA